MSWGPCRGGNAILIVGSDGIGSMATQLAKAWTALTIITTAALPEGGDRARSLSAHHVIDYRQSLDGGFKALEIAAPGFVLSTTHTQAHLPEVVKLIAPQGRIAFIDDPTSLDIAPLKPKMLSAHWEYMFSRAMYRTADMIKQHDLLNDVADMIDSGSIISTLTKRLSPIFACKSWPGRSIWERFNAHRRKRCEPAQSA
jgi:NADPH:quinone reductase-like Zn-dependent oxidoreductase